MKGKNYKCINNEGGIDSFTIGKVYECITDDIDDFGAFIDDKGDPNGWCGQNYIRFLLDEGVRYSEEDMRAAFVEGFRQAMIALDKLPGKQVSIDEFIKGRESK